MSEQPKNPLTFADFLAETMKHKPIFGSADALLEDAKQKQQLFAKLLEPPLPRPYDVKRELSANWSSIWETYARRN